jgi:hypothetical protein
MVDFQGAKITLDMGFLRLEEINKRFGSLGPIVSELTDTRSSFPSKHTRIQMDRQRVYLIAASYGGCNDEDLLWINPALHLAVGKGDQKSERMLD